VVSQFEDRNRDEYFALSPRFALTSKESSRRGCVEHEGSSASVRFLSDGIGELVLEKLGKAIEAHLAVAFFNPSDRMLYVLARIKKLKLIVSEEFSINNPYKLEKLKAAALRSVPPDDANGKLHAKVLIVKLPDGSYWTLLGSANLTHQGMFSNQEACVVMESDNPADEISAREISGWFDSLFQSAKFPNLDQAKLIFDTRSQYQLVRRTSLEMATDAGYWALKTTSGSSGKSHWPMFLAESVVAIGWSELPVDPSKVSDLQLQAALRKKYDYSDRQATIHANQIGKFVGLKKGDMVLVCRGYAPVQEKDVHIHGIARVMGAFRAEAWKKGEWRFKHGAVIQEIDLDLPREVVASALRKQSLRQTIHALEKADFDRLVKKLKEFGVHIEV
jgi:HKD family nuclease